jgi:hypothetical protein
VISNVGRGGRRYLPYVFTEHGVAMLSSVLKSQRAVQINILIIRAFIRLREYLSTHRDIARQLQDIQRIQRKHGQHIRRIYSLIEKLLEVPEAAPKRRIGFTASTPVAG